MAASFIDRLQPLAWVSEDGEMAITARSKSTLLINSRHTAELIKPCNIPVYSHAQFSQFIRQAIAIERDGCMRVCVLEALSVENAKNDSSPYAWIARQCAQAIQYRDLMDKK